MLHHNVSVIQCMWKRLD